MAELSKTSTPSRLKLNVTSKEKGKPFGDNSKRILASTDEWSLPHSLFPRSSMELKQKTKTQEMATAYNTFDSLSTLITSKKNKK